MVNMGNTSSIGACEDFHVAGCVANQKSEHDQTGDGCNKFLPNRTGEEEFQAFHDFV